VSRKTASDVPDKAQTYANYEEFEKATFPRARNERLRLASRREAPQIIAESVLSALRKQLGQEKQ
jgi:hypothetical protein